MELTCAKCQITFKNGGALGKHSKENACSKKRARTGSPHEKRARSEAPYGDGRKRYGTLEPVSLVQSPAMPRPFVTSMIAIIGSK